MSHTSFSSQSFGIGAIVGSCSLFALQSSADIPAWLKPQAASPAAASASAATPAAVAAKVAAATQGAVDFASVRKAIAALLQEDDNRGPLFVRLAWHSSGTYDKAAGKYGSNGGTIRFSPEIKHGANKGLDTALELLKPIKSKFPDLSWADLITLSGVVAVEEMGGPQVPWKPGRKDAPTAESCAPEGNLPDASKDHKHIRAIFNRMGFTDREIVALSGAHTLGRCHTDRSGFEGPWTRAPTTFSNAYFKELTENKWTERKWAGPKQYQDPTGELMMLPTDMWILWDPEFAKIAREYAANEDAFFRDFASAFGKLLAL